MVQVPPSNEERVLSVCRVLLQRHGIVTREAVMNEGIPGGFTGLYPAFRQMEESGKVRRGYFIDGLGASQFALPGAVDRLRSYREAAPGVVLLSATDPANQFGVTAKWPDLAGRVARVAGAYVVIDGGDLRMFIERGGRSLITNGSIGEQHVAVLQTVAVRHGKIEVTSVNGEPINEAVRIAALLLASGFVPSPRGLVLYPPRASLLRR